MRAGARFWLLSCMKQDQRRQGASADKAGFNPPAQATQPQPDTTTQV
jgi:hypothetical protein